MSVIRPFVDPCAGNAGANGPEQECSVAVRYDRILGNIAMVIVTKASIEWYQSYRA